jgi:hypothetical protein
MGISLIFQQVQVLETVSCRNAGEDCVHKTQSSQTLRKWELHALDCPFSEEKKLCGNHLVGIHLSEMF